MNRMGNSRVSRAILLIGGLAGLLLRIGMLFHMGVFDMDAYYEWGRRALELGLPASYHGIYFPLQYQIFEACAWTVARSGAEFFVIFKLANMVFDLGNFILLMLLLKRNQTNPAYALIYWLFPWFLGVFSLGYVDFQFTFFVLLTLWMLRTETTKSFLIAGLAFGCAFLMKPQAQVLFIAVCFYVVYRGMQKKDWHPVAMLVGSAVLFAAYQAYFIISLGGLWSSYVWTRLPLSYLNISNVMPALTAQMTNIWYPVAYLIKKPGAPIYSVSDQIYLLPFLSVKHLAAAVVLGLLGLYVVRLERLALSGSGEKFTRLFLFVALLVPLVMTSAHENHLFLGTVLLIPLMARSGAGQMRIAGIVLLSVQFLQIYGLYGAYPAMVGEILRRTHSDEMAIVYSLVSLGCFGVILRALWSKQATRPSEAAQLS